MQTWHPHSGRVTALIEAALSLPSVLPTASLSARLRRASAGRTMEPDPTALSAPLNADTDDDELYERLQRRHVVKEKATYVCLVLFIMLLLAAALPAMLYWLAAYRKATPDKFLLPVSLIFAGISILIFIFYYSLSLNMSNAFLSKYNQNR